MAGDAHDDEKVKLTGISKYFNGITTRGRANVAMATYACIGAVVVYFVFKPKAKKDGV